MTERGRAHPASRSPWYAWIYVWERQRGIHVCVITLLTHICSISAAAVGGESQEASGLATCWLAVLTNIQGHQGVWWSCAVLWGERGQYKSTEQVDPLSVHKVSQWNLKRTKVPFYSWFNVSLRPCSSLFSYVSDYMVKEQHCRMQGRGIRSESQESRSPDSACSLGYNSRESSPDRVLDGEVLLWWQQEKT